MEPEPFAALCYPGLSKLAVGFTSLGAAFHLCVHPYEVDYYILRLLCVYAWAWCTLVAIFSQKCAFGIVSAGGRASLAGLSFNAGLALSMGVYRVFFHRLRCFPGPFAARLSKFYAFMLQWKNFQYFSDQWTMFYSFDVLGLVGFSEDFKQLESGQEHYAIRGVHDQVFMLGLLNQIPWLSYPLNALQPLSGGFGVFKMYCNEMVKKSALGGKFQTTESPVLVCLEPKRWGSDTTGNTLACALHYLCVNPSAYKKLQEQLDSIISDEGTSLSYANIRKIAFLDAILKETMRLKPAVPGGQPRVTPVGGLHIGDIWIPGDINVLVPQYALQRDDRFFHRASEFLPERWLENRNSWALDEQAYFPFQIGPRACVGKEFAMMSMRILLARIALNFDIAFAPGEDGVEFDTRARDYLAIDVGPLYLVFSERRSRQLGKP
ncbi:hypothetical protein CDD83_1173 [Cordyceps sp. RAO-2017]|nr:hypothetical protein CDD83_1173 [Cordyceps sp. RAO-2017]